MLAPEIRLRWTTSLPFVVIGTVGIVAGGVAAAVTGPTDWSNGSWRRFDEAGHRGRWIDVHPRVDRRFRQAALAPNLPSRGLVLGQCVTWNVGSAGVIIGTLVDSPALVSAGSAVFLVAVALAAFAARGHSGLTGRARVFLLAFRVLLVVLLVSTPIGIVLSWARG